MKEPFASNLNIADQVATAADFSDEFISAAFYHGGIVYANL